MPSYWIGQLEEENEGEGTIRIVRRAEEDDVEGHPWRHGLQQTDDAEGQRLRRLHPEGDDTIGHPMRHLEPIDKEQGLYLVEVDSDEDVTGQAYKHGLAAEHLPEGKGA